jgi:tetratricopeptide (TPR) repeat protein
MLPVLASYIRLLVWPVPGQLSVMYFPPMRSGFDAAVASALILALVLITVGIYLYRTARPCLFWYLLFFVGLLPVSQLIPLITLMNDRYLYFPMLGIAGVAAYVGEKVRILLISTPMRRWLITMASVLVICLAVLAHLRGKVWRNSITLFSDLTAKYPDQSTSWARLAEGYIASGDISIAQHYYEKATVLGPVDNDGLYNLVQIYFEKGLLDKAYEQIWMMLLRGDQANRGMLLLGEYYFRTGEEEKAKEKLSQYLSYSPDSSHGLFLLGQACLMTGHDEQAGGYFRKSLIVSENSSGTMLKASENQAATLYSLACAELHLGRTAQATAALQAAFEKGLNLKGSDRCLQDMQAEPHLREMIQQHGGE